LQIDDRTLPAIDRDPRLSAGSFAIQFCPCSVIGIRSVSAIFMLTIGVRSKWEMMLKKLSLSQLS
jgi:hypothetical protein